MISTDQFPDEKDREFFQRELADFVPNKVFDAHVHLWRPEQFDGPLPGVPQVISHQNYRQLLDSLHPGRACQALFMGWPYDCKVRMVNEWVAEETAAEPSCRGLFICRPTDDPEWLRQEVRRLGLHGLKPYHFWASVKPTWEADIPDYLPESHVKVAHEEGWFITLHIVKARALGDPSNVHWIKHYCKKYPNMKMILAHSGRGHQPSHNLEGLPKLKGLDNLYFDCSVVCEPMGHATVIRIMGHERLMYGSDFLGFRGRSVGVADTFLWLFEQSQVWKEKHAQIKPVFVGLEGLRALRWACWSEKLSDTQVEDIFWNNAARLFNLRS